MSFADELKSLNQIKEDGERVIRRQEAELQAKAKQNRQKEQENRINEELDKVKKWLKEAALAGQTFYQYEQGYVCLDPHDNPVCQAIKEFCEKEGMRARYSYTYRDSAYGLRGENGVIISWGEKGSW